MKCEKLTDNIAIVRGDGGEPLFQNTQSGLDVISSLWELGDQKRVIVEKKDVDEGFFDLKTGIAGEIVQKFVNYGFRLAIAGDFSVYTSKSLADYIRESNKGSAIYFAESVEDAVNKLEK